MRERWRERERERERERKVRYNQNKPVCKISIPHFKLIARCITIVNNKSKQFQNVVNNKIGKVGNA